MNAHTPAPWIWGDDYKGLYGAGPENEVLNYEPFEGMWLGYGPARDANALLIAAAPELLAACKKALYAIKGREHTGFLEKAIAKATGGAA